MGENITPQEAREVLRGAFAPREAAGPLLRPMLALVAVTLVLLYGVVHSQWTPVELMLAYLAEIVAFTFWYGVRLAVIVRQFKSFLGVLMICGVAIFMTTFLLHFLGEYNVRAGWRAARLPALILFAVYGWEAWLAWRGGALEKYSQQDMLRLALAIALYVILGVFTILACIFLDKGFRAQTGGMVTLVMVKFVLDMLLRMRLRF